MPLSVQKRRRAAQEHEENHRGRHTTPDANRQRSVSFSRRHLGAATSTEPGHRVGEPVRSSLRSPSPVKTVPVKTRVGRDEHICAKVHELRDEVFAIAAIFKPNRYTLDRILNDPGRASETCRYIECLVIPERTGEHFWESFLGGPNLPIVVAGLIGRALQQHVLGVLLFGCDEDQLAVLEADEQRDDLKDSYERIYSRAQLIKKIHTSKKQVVAAQSRVACSIFKLIAPLSHLDEKRLARQIYLRIESVVTHAAAINHTLRSDADILWQWTDIWKDSRFEPASTEAVNLVEVFETTSYEGPGSGGATLREGYEDKPDPIVRMIVFPGLTAWRRTEEDGVVTGDRARRIMNNVALIEWARQRKLTAAAGTSYHLDAVKNKKTAEFDHDEVGAINLWNLVFEI